MLFNDFASRMHQDLVTELNKKLNTNISSELTNLEKLQGQSYTGLSIRFKDSNAGAIYNLSEAFRKLQDGETYSQLLEEAVLQMENALHDIPDIPFDVLCNYNVMKAHLTLQLISKSHNESALDGVAYTEVAEDLVLVYRLLLPSFDNKDASILIRNDYIESMGISIEQLHNDALVKSSEILPLKFISLAGYLSQTIGLSEDDKHLPDPDVWIVTNTKMCLGASALFYPGSLDMICTKLGGGSFYIIPSSIHECLVCSEKSSPSWEYLERILNEVNAKVLDTDEILSDQLYYYNSLTQNVELAANHLTPVF